jgi:hypothetical protein
MPRPVKLTVDYFSHDANASGRKTLTILFNHFGHDGISAWWQLLESLAGTPGHFIDVRYPECFEYLSAKMRLNPDRTKSILLKMAELDAIDRELYTSGIIWSQHLIDRLAEVYKKRNQELPPRPVINNLVSDTNNAVINTDNATNKIKVNKSKLNQSPSEEGGFAACNSLEDYRALMIKAPNQVGFLVSAFKHLHFDAPQEDIDGCGGRIADWWKRKSRDTRYLLGVIWDTKNKQIMGSHLNYIDGVIFPKKDIRNLNTGNTGRDTRDPDKYISGKHGHVVMDAAEFAEKK